MNVPSRRTGSSGSHAVVTLTAERIATAVLVAVATAAVAATATATCVATVPAAAAVAAAAAEEAAAPAAAPEATPADAADPALEAAWEAIAWAAPSMPEGGGTAPPPAPTFAPANKLWVLLAVASNSTAVAITSSCGSPPRKYLEVQLHIVVVHPTRARKTHK